jgi:hypothetical protein
VIRLMLAMVVACALTTACSKASAPQSAGAGDKAAAPGAAPAGAPSGQAAAPAAPATSTPAGATAEAPPATAPPARESTAEATTPPASAPPAEPAPPPPPEPTFREVTIPADTSLTVKLTTPIASDTSNVEDPVSGTLARSIVVGGKTAVPAGSRVTGSVLEANRSARVKGRASIAFRFDHLVVRGERHTIQTNRVAREASADTKGDVKKGGIGAGAGAIIGGITGGGKGAAIGGAIGGTGAVMATRGKEIRLAAGDTVVIKLQEPLAVLVPIEKTESR